MVAGPTWTPDHAVSVLFGKLFSFPERSQPQLQLRPARMRVVALVRCGWEPGWLPGPASICDLPRSRAREQQLRVRRGRAGHRDACTASGPWPLRNTCSPRRLAQRGEGLLLQHGHLRALRAPGGAGAGHWYSALQARTRPVWPNPGGTLPPSAGEQWPFQPRLFSISIGFPTASKREGAPPRTPLHPTSPTPPRRPAPRRWWHSPTFCPRRWRQMTWTAICTKQWGTRSLRPTPSAWACRSSAAASAAARGSRWARVGREVHGLGGCDWG